MRDLITQTISIGGITWTQTGTVSAIKHTINQLKKRRKVKLTEQEQRNLMRESDAHRSLNGDKLAKAWKIYKHHKIKGSSSPTILGALRAEFNCSAYVARTIQKKIRAQHADQIRTFRPEFWK